MDIRTRITEFIEKRSKKKVNEEGRPSSPWWRRFSKFRKFFIRKKKNKVLPSTQLNAGEAERLVLDSQKSITWCISNQETKDNEVVEETTVFNKEEDIDGKVLWKLVNADPSTISETEGKTCDEDVACIENDKKSLLTRNLQCIEDYSEELNHMIRRAGETWTKICQGPFPQVKKLDKGAVIDLMSRNCIDNTNKLVDKLDNAVQDLYNIMDDIDEHLGLQVDFKNRLKCNKNVTTSIGRVHLVRSCVKPKAFPTHRLKGFRLKNVTEDLTPVDM